MIYFNLIYLKHKIVLMSSIDYNFFLSYVLLRVNLRGFPYWFVRRHKFFMVKSLIRIGWKFRIVISQTCIIDGFLRLIFWLEAHVFIKKLNFLIILNSYLLFRRKTWIFVQGLLIFVTCKDIKVWYNECLAL